VLEEIVAPLAGLRLSSGRPAVRLILGIRTMRFAGDDVDVDQIDDLSTHDGIADLSRRVHGLLPGSVIELSALTDSENTYEELHRYTASLLNWPQSSPYADARAAVPDPDTILGACGPDFAICGAAADALRRGKLQPDQAGSADVLIASLAPVIRAARLDRLAAEIARLSGHCDGSADVHVAALRATALAVGAGAPAGGLWATMTAAVLGTPGQAAPDIAKWITRIPCTGLAGHLIVYDDLYRLRFLVADDIIDPFLAEDPASLWAAVRRLAPGPQTNEHPALLDPAAAVHRRLTQALVQRMLEDGAITTGSADTDQDASTDPPEHHAIHWLRWQSTAAGATAKDRLDAAVSLAEYGATDAAAAAMIIITIEDGALLRTRYEAAVQLWIMERRAEALTACRLLADIPGKLQQQDQREERERVRIQATISEAIRRLENGDRLESLFDAPGMSMPPPSLGSAPPLPIF
jgi:hypothetical protein